MNEEEIINRLNYSQQQMRLGNLPDYNQSHYEDVEALLSMYQLSF